jgi:hypothetical protein
MNAENLLDNITNFYDRLDRPGLLVAAATGRSG